MAGRGRYDRLGRVPNIMLHVRAFFLQLLGITAVTDHDRPVRVQQQVAAVPAEPGQVGHIDLYSTDVD